MPKQNEVRDVQIRFNIDGDTFTDNPSGEIARVLRHVADGIEKGLTPPFAIRDSNGNVIGRGEVIVEELKPPKKGD